MYFLTKIIFHFTSLEKTYFRGKEMPSFLMKQEISCSMRFFWKEHLFRTFEENIIFSCFFFKERSSFIFRPKNKIIFSERRSINFPDDTRKIIFQCNLFGNAIYISLSSLFMNISTGLVLQYNYCYQYTFCCLIKNVKNH